ncbi:MAG: MBL fold metallo-hydrolase [Nanoarchaeota archaeon]|nr:MBL fold metallo-hydrolase [Nanoarchaeota archaeon]
MDELVFLGSGGGRHTMLFQSRSTAGIVYKTCNHQVHIDPGPGALLRCKECNIYPFKTDILIATHNHIDHVNDLNVLIEGMSQAAAVKKGTLVTSEEVYETCVSDYHKTLVKEVKLLKPGEAALINGLRIEAIKVQHSLPGGVGYKFHTPNYCLYYTSDTSTYPGFENNLKKVDVLIANVIRPGDKKWAGHICSDDLVSAVRNSKHNIKLIIINHFGTLMLRADPEVEAERIMAETGVKTVAASDSLIIKLNDSVSLRE